MPGRKFTGSSSYRYGMNGQEKDNEIFEGAYTAKYWEYDSRTGRRWNIDPVDQVSISNYATFANNPVLLTDVNGDVVSGGNTKVKPGGEIPEDSPLKRNYFVLGGTPSLTYKPTNHSTLVTPLGGNQVYNNTNITDMAHLTEPNVSVQYLRVVGVIKRSVETTDTKNFLIQAGVYGYKEKRDPFSFIGSNGGTYYAKEEAPFSAGLAFAITSNALNKKTDYLAFSATAVFVPFGIQVTHTQFEPVPPGQHDDPNIHFKGKGIGTNTTGHYHHRGNNSTLLLKINTTIVGYGILYLGVRVHRVHYNEIGTDFGPIPKRDEYSLGLEWGFGTTFGGGKKKKAE